VRLRIPNPAGYALADLSSDGNTAVSTILYRRGVSWEDRDKPLLLVRVDPAGHELTRLELPALPQRSYEQGRLSRAIQGLAVPAALGCIGILRSDGPDLPTAIASVAMGIVCTIIAAMVLRAYVVPLRWRVFWLALVFILGVGGLLLMFAVRHWPPRVACPSCHRKRLATRERCEHCAAPFPIPDPGPIGIFDQVGEPAQVGQG
jgi:hypothetical protein